MIPISFAILLPTLLGCLVIALLFQKNYDQAAAPLERLCLAYPLGMGILTFQMFFLGLARVPLTLLSTSSIIFMEIVGLSLWIGKKKITLFPKPSFGLYEEIIGHDTSRVKKVALVVLTIWIGTKLISILLETYLRPIYAWDVWANWSVGAKVFYYSHSLLLDAPADDFFGRSVESRIISYPLHNPLMQVWLSLWAGGFDEVLAKFWSPLYLLSMAGCLYAFARREIGRLAALGVLAIFLGSPFMSYHAIEAYSDLSLGINLFFALLSFLNAMRGKQAYWPLVGVFSTIALFTKNEAPGFIFPLLLSAFAYLLINRNQIPLKNRLFQLLVPFSFVLPWFLFKSAHSLSLTQDSHKIEPMFHSGVVPYVLDQLLGLQNFNILLISLPVLLLINGRPTKELLHVLFPVAFYALFFIALYTLIEYYYTTLLMGTIFYRNTLTFYPSVALLTVLVLKELLTKTKPGIPVATRSLKRRK